MCIACLIVDGAVYETCKLSSYFRMTVPCKVSLTKAYIIIAE